MKNRRFTIITMLALVLAESYALADDPISGEDLQVALKNKNHKVRTRAAEKLREYDFTGDPAMIEAIVQALKDEDEDVRRLAAASLDKLRKTKHAKSVVSALTEVACNDRDLKVREHAVGTLACLELDARGAVPALVKSLTDKNASYRETVLCALTQIDPVDKACIQSFLKFAKDTDTDVRSRALNGLYFAVRNGADKKVVIPAIAEALEDKVPGVRASAASILGFLGTAGASYLPAIKAMAEKDENKFTRKDAAEAVRLIKKAIAEQTTQ